MPDFLSFKGGPDSARVSGQEDWCDLEDWELDFNSSNNFNIVTGGGCCGTSGKWYYIHPSCSTVITKNNPALPCGLRTRCVWQTSEAEGCGGLNPQMPTTNLRNVCGQITAGTRIKGSDVTNFLKKTTITASSTCFIIGWISDGLMCDLSGSPNFTDVWWTNLAPKMAASRTSNSNHIVYSDRLNTGLEKKYVSSTTADYLTLGTPVDSNTGFSSAIPTKITSPCIFSDAAQTTYASSTTRCARTRIDFHRAYYFKFGCGYAGLSMFASTSLPTLEDCQPCKDKVT